jgi:hypothetical protein
MGEQSFEISTISVFNNGDIVHLQKKAVHLACQKREQHTARQCNSTHAHLKILQSLTISYKYSSIHVMHAFGTVL